MFPVILLPPSFLNFCSHSDKLAEDGFLVANSKSRRLSHQRRCGAQTGSCVFYIKLKAFESTRVNSSDYKPTFSTCAALPPTNTST